MKPIYVPDHAPGMAELHMENDLLAHENRILRARLEGASMSVEPDSIAAKGHDDAAKESDELFRRAYYDLRWLIERLNGSPLGIVLRRWNGFRVLLARYGRSAQ